MPDLAKIVDYEFLYALELKHPNTDEPVGVTFNLRSAASEESKKVLRKHGDKNIERRMKNKTIKGEAIERQELEKAASYIASWDWHGNSFEGEIDPPLTTAKAIEIMDKQSWVFQQVVEAANDVANFSPK